LLLTMAVEEFVEGALLWVMKWLVIGTFKEREVVFFGLEHFLWMVWLMVSSTFNHLEAFHGTALYGAFLRAMGSKVGGDCTLFGFTLEFDLLHIGDRASVGLDCDMTCHTVENMVLKMVPVRLGSYSSMQRHSFVMPGAELGEGAVLLEESQVLKGEVVPAGEVWAGNPAERLRGVRHRSRLWPPGRAAPLSAATAELQPEFRRVRDDSETPAFAQKTPLLGESGGRSFFRQGFSRGASALLFGDCVDSEYVDVGQLEV
jgi:hypothetical protein